MPRHCLPPAELQIKSCRFRTHEQLKPKSNLFEFTVKKKNVLKQEEKNHLFPCIDASIKTKVTGNKKKTGLIQAISIENEEILFKYLLYQRDHSHTICVRIVIYAFLSKSNDLKRSLAMKVHF